MEKMKKLLCISLILFAFACASDPQKEMEKAIVGEWCNPYTYQSTGELKGFNFKKGGVCEAINIPSLYATKEKIGQLTTDSLCLVVKEANPRLAFLYLNSKVIKERVNAQK